MKIQLASLALSLIFTSASLQETLGRPTLVASARTPSEQLAALNLRAENSLQDRGADEVEELLREAGKNSTSQPKQHEEATQSITSEDWQSKPAETHKLIQLLLWPFMACLVLTGIHCYLGIHVVARGVIFVDLALAQMAALGSILVLFVPAVDAHGKEAYALSLATTLLGAALFATGRLRKQVVPQEAIIGIIYAVSSALALLLLSKAPSHAAEETKHMLVGRLLDVEDIEVWKMAGLYTCVGLFHWVFRRQFLQISLHPELAQEQGIAVRRWDFLFYASFGMVVTSSVHVAGVLLVFSYLVVPAVCATLLAKNISTRLIIGWTIGFLASVLGLFVSVEFDLPPGESVVSMFGGLLILVALARWFRTNY